jgi:hypothetical protein
MDENIDELNESYQKMFSNGVEEIQNKEENEIYYNRYVLFNNNEYSDIEIKFNKFNMYLNFKILSKFSKFFESKQSFEYRNKNNDKLIITADDIYDNHLPLQQTLTWFYFQYKDIIKPIDYDYVSLFYLNNYLIICDDFLIQIIDMIFDVRNNSIFYKKLYNGFNERLLDENTIVNIHRFILNRTEFLDIGFVLNAYNQRNCNSCGYNTYKYCCKKCNYCENHCKCQNIYHPIIYILPSLWLTTINKHSYPVDIINFRKSINQNINNQEINIDYEKLDKLLNKIEQIDDIKISISIIFGILK